MPNVKLRGPNSLGRGTENIHGAVERPKLLGLPLSEGLGSAGYDARSSEAFAIFLGLPRRFPLCAGDLGAPCVQAAANTRG